MSVWMCTSPRSTGLTLFGFYARHAHMSEQAHNSRCVHAMCGGVVVVIVVGGNGSKCMGLSTLRTKYKRISGAYMRSERAKIFSVNVSV